MSDCTGYGVRTLIDLCVSGPVGDNNTATLQIRISDVGGGQTFNGGAIVLVPDWDGRRRKVDVTGTLNLAEDYSFPGANCDLTAFLTIIPSGQGASGTLLLEFVFANCAPNANGVSRNGPDVFNLCGGAGPHIVSEMSTFTLSEGSCGITL